MTVEQATSRKSSLISPKLPDHDHDSVIVHLVLNGPVPMRELVSHSYV